MSLWITLAGLAILLVGTAIGGKAGVMREKELDGSAEASSTKQQRTTRMFAIGMLSCLVSGVFSACVALGWAEGEPLSKAMMKLREETWRPGKQILSAGSPSTLVAFFRSLFSWAAKWSNRGPGGIFPRPAAGAILPLPLRWELSTFVPISRSG